MEKILLVAHRRTDKRTAKALRREGLLPAVLYGHHISSTPVTLDAHEAGLKLAGLSSSTIVNIDLDGDTHAALVRERQKDYVKNVFIHVDFQVVSLTEKIRTTVSLVFDGVSPAVKDFNGVVVNNVTEIEVEAFPQDLPERIHVDISSLKSIGDSLYVRDLPISPNVTLLTDPSEVVVLVSAPREEAEVEVTEAEISEPEVIERGKKEEEEIE